MENFSYEVIKQDSKTGARAGILHTPHGDIVPPVVATGGLSHDIIQYCNHDIIYNENLLLEGLREIYERNK